MTPVVFALSGYDKQAIAIAKAIDGEVGSLALHRFPDGEGYVRLDAPVADREVVFVGSLNDPDSKALSLLFAAATARELGGHRVGLVAPYLAYMRQDRRFKPGEAVTSATFAHLLSSYFDWLVTVDPHLHRYRDLSAIYSIVTHVVPAAPSIAAWLQDHVRLPLLIGPDSESAQWVEEIAHLADAPYEILEKVRRGDREVAVSAPQVERWRDHTPVLADDIIASGRTMAMTVKSLRDAGMAPPVCIGVHAVFAGDALEVLQAAGPERIVSCNTIAHATNAIDLDQAIAEAVRCGVTV